MPDNAKAEPDPVWVKHQAENEARALMRRQASRFFETFMQQLKRTGSSVVKSSWATPADQAAMSDTIVKNFETKGFEAFLKELDNYRFGSNLDPQKNLRAVMRIVFMSMSVAVETAYWHRVALATKEAFENLLVSFDISDWPDAFIPPGTKVSLPDVDLEIDHVNGIPALFKITDKDGVIRYDRRHIKSDCLNYNGKFVTWIDQMPQFQRINRLLADKHRVAAKAIIDTLDFADQPKRHQQGDRFQIETSDGRVITGFIADDEYFLESLAGEPFPNCDEKWTVSATIRTFFENQPGAEGAPT